MPTFEEVVTNAANTINELVKLSHNLPNTQEHAFMKNLLIPAITGTFSVLGEQHKFVEAALSDLDLRLGNLSEDLSDDVGLLALHDIEILGSVIEESITMLPDEEFVKQLDVDEPRGKEILSRSEELKSKLAIAITIINNVKSFETTEQEDEEAEEEATRSATTESAMNEDDFELVD